MLNWRQLAGLSEEELGRHDIVAVNLACAVGLPGWDGAETADVIRRIDAMAEGIRKTTDELLPRWRRAGYDSKAKWRASLMIKLLWEEYGVRYNRAKIPLDVPMEVPDVFLHGILFGQGGTCASLPVLYAAVGRRLAYPVKLVAVVDVRAKVGHRFCRWDGASGDKFNFEGYEGKAAIAPDHYYRTDYALEPRIERAGKFLQSKAPKEELGAFLMDRGQCWKELGNLPLAAQAYVYGSSLAPDNIIYRDATGMLLNCWMDAQDARKPPNFPQVWVTAPCRIFPTVDLRIEQSYLAVQAIELALQEQKWQRRWWEPMRRGAILRDVPTMMKVHWEPNGCNINFDVAQNVFA